MVSDKNKFINFIKKNYVVIILALILVFATFLRLYKIEDYMTFLGDEGRDVLIVRDILHGHLTFLGPRTSAADFYTGPIYYYMMAPFLFLANYNPVGPAIMIALLGIATVYLVFRFGREWFGTTAALVAAGLYTISPLVIAYSRSSWNPNPMPFFTLIILYLLYKAVNAKPNIKTFLLIGVLYGIAFQLHYIEIIVGVVMFFFILFGNILISKKDIVSKLIKEYISIFIGFLIGLSPFLAFELRHGFPNTKTVIAFMLKGDPKATDITTASFPQIVWDVFTRLFGRLVLFLPPLEKLELLNKNTVIIWIIAAVVLAILSILALLNVKDKRTKLLFGLWLFFGVVLFGFYHKPIYDYYFEFMFPLPFLLVGNLFSYGMEKGKIAKVVAILILVGIVGLNLSGYPFQYPANRQYRQVEKISKFVLDKAQNKPFNFALLTLGNSDHAYRYIFEVNGHPPTTIQYTGIDPDRKSVTDQLFVVCEDPNCQPLGNSLWEVAGFGRSEIAAEWLVSVVKVYKLVHYNGNNE
ncbi:MAG TPA: glycosyltransferase family 39 protein [Patescibacteria group bacterium]|nr:glycosyltransferase family 39 protein [Patescibacteria group bacterium]